MLARLPETVQAGTTDVPMVGQRDGGQGPDSDGIASGSGVWVCGATPTWPHGWTGSTGEGIATLKWALLPAGIEEGDKTRQTPHDTTSSVPYWNPEIMEIALFVKL